MSSESGIYSLEAFKQFGVEGPTLGRVYKDADLSVVVWNLEPGQVTDTHSHPDSAHAMLVLAGEGEYVRGGDPPRPIRAGDCVVVPRQVDHTIRNTSRERLSYAAVTNQGPSGYTRVYPGA